MTEIIKGPAKSSQHIFVLVDTSGGMNSWRMESLNTAMPEMLLGLKDWAIDQPHLNVYLSVIDFSTGAVWREKMTALSDYGEWEPLFSEGVTDLGAAFRLLTEELTTEKLGPGLYPPLLVLLLEGIPTDDWEKELWTFNGSDYGKRQHRTIRVAIAVGEDADTESLTAFTGNPELVFEVNNATSLRNVIQWTGTIPRMRPQRSPGMDGQPAEASLPEPPPPSDDTDDSWD